MPIYELLEKCPTCGSKTIVKSGKVAGGTGSVPYKRNLCGSPDCDWVGGMVEQTQKVKE